MNFICFFLLLVMVLLSVAFVTLLERKVLSYIQVRKGPNKVGMGGVLQPFADAVKLFTKENSFLVWYNMAYFMLVPLFSLFLMLLFWIIFPWCYMKGYLKYEMFFFLVISSLGVYTLLGGGWSSNSKYALLGSYRGVAQTISYEVSLSFLLLSVLLFSESFNMYDLVYSQEYLMFLLGMWNIFLMWMVTVLAETNRTPFDFAEGESELVSGFNVEYGGGGFAILFMAEYGNIIFMSVVSSSIFLGGMGYFSFKMMLILLFILWMRGTLVRFRYDILMGLAWKMILPFSIICLIFMMEIFIF